MFTKMRAAAAAVAAAGAIALAGASGASAATIDVGSLGTPTGASGSMALNATAGASRLVVTSGAGIPLNCTSSSGTGNINTGSYTVPPTATIGTIVPVFQNCTGPLGLAFTVNCASTTTDLNLTGTPTGSPATTPGSITGISCVIRFTATGCTANVTGSVQGSYTNPSITTDAKLKVFAAGQSLTVSGSGCPAIIPNGPADFGAPGAGSTGLADLEYTVTGDTIDQPFVTDTM